MNTTNTQPTPSLPTDYASLRQAGIDLLQSWVGDAWTDFNEHDPGITLLENLCYALTDLVYRSGYSMPDLLSNGDGEPYASLYTPGKILTTQPVTLLDLRKLVVDVRGVGNAWFEKVENFTPPAYYHAKTLPYLKNDLSEQFILTGSSQTDKPLNINGLYRVWVEKNESLDVDSGEIVRDVAKRLHAHRPLSMDFDSVQVMDTQEIQVKATIEIGTEGDANDIYVAILQRLADYIAPKLQFYPWAGQLAAGQRSDQIFDGPNLNQGFIDSQELFQLQRKTTLRVADFIREIMAVEGVVMVKYIGLSLDGVVWKNWSLDLDNTQSTSLDYMNSILKLERKQFPVSLDPTNQSRYVQARKGLEYQTASLAELDVITAPGRNRQVERYYSVQHQLPLNYGVGAFGLPPQADAKRRAQAKQLKAYLLLFEQLLANEFGQVGHLGNLLGFVSDDPSTYFSVPIDDDSLGLDALWQDGGNLPQRLTQIVENPATAKDDQTPQVDWQRRNRLLDHLLARFAGQYQDYAQFEPTPPDAATTPARLAAIKRAWLQSYPELSRGRGTGSDITQPSDANEPAPLLKSSNIAGLLKNLVIKLGVFATTDVEPNASPAVSVHSPLPSPGNAVILTAIPAGETPALPGGERLHPAYPFLSLNSQEWPIYLVEHALLRPIDADMAQSPCPLMANARSADPYSLQISLVLPIDQPPFNDTNYRRFVEKTVSEECPAHLSVYLVWLDGDDMDNFPIAYKAWQKSLSQYRKLSNDLGPHPDPTAKNYHAICFQLRDARDRLINLLGIGQTYPLADVAFAVEGQWNVSNNSPLIYGDSISIKIDYPQSGVYYQLVDANGNTLSTGNPIFGNQSSMTLTTGPLYENQTIHIQASIDKGDAPPLTVILQQSFLIIVQPNLNLGVTATHDSSYNVFVAIANSQASVTYSLWSRNLWGMDLGKYSFSSGIAYPFSADLDKAQFQQIDNKPGNGGELILNGLYNPAQTFLVKASKTYQTSDTKSNTIEYYLNQAVEIDSNSV
ncbi:MAG: hypothetical protein NTX45_15505 [Proteobacteria bacterium]|nr:hypothetical protein [Pseudomonadota bacterium]